MTSAENAIFEEVLRNHVATSELRDVYRNKMILAGKFTDEQVKAILTAGADNTNFNGGGKKK